MLPNCCRKYGYVTLHCKDVHPRRIREDSRRQSPSNRHVIASISISATTCLCLVSSTAILFPMVMVTLSFGSDVLARIRSCNWSNDVIFPPTPGSGNQTFMFLQICMEYSHEAVWVWSLRTYCDRLLSFALEFDGYGHL